MDTSSDYADSPLTFAEVEAFDDPTLLDFGTSWCGFCRAARPLVAEALADHPRVRHIMIADGPGRRLGRQFGVKLWPTLIVLSGGDEVARVVRPADADSVRRALGKAGGD